jgi:hypothetical protein
MKNVKTQKIYTFPDRKLYGEYCLLSLLELRIKISKGEIKEQLCYLDDNDRAYVFDKFSVPEEHIDNYIETQYSKLLTDLFREQIHQNENTVL